MNNSLNSAEHQPLQVSSTAQVWAGLYNRVPDFPMQTAAALEQPREPLRASVGERIALARGLSPQLANLLRDAEDALAS